MTDQGQRLSFLHATGRYFAKFISAIILGIGFLMIAFTDRKRGLHDMIAGTLVIKVRRRQALHVPLALRGESVRGVGGLA